MYTICTQYVHNMYYNRKVLTETGSRTTGLSFNVRVLYQLSYFDLLLFCYLDLEVVLINRAFYGVFNAMRGWQGSHMNVGSYSTQYVHTICTQYLRNMYTVCTQYVHNFNVDHDKT